MIIRHIRTMAIAGLALALPVLAGGTAIAEVVSGPPPVHTGDPALWGPALEADGICADPQIARNRGYNVIEGDNFGNVLVGGPAADALYGWGGNDKIFGGPGDDVACAGFGNDKLRGDQGNDALYGEAANDILRGDNGRDFTDGDGQTDDCDGGAASDAEEECEI